MPARPTYRSPLLGRLSQLAISVLLPLTLALTAALAPPAVFASPDDAGDYAGLELRAAAEPADIGLPVYPGARRAPKQGDESSAVNMALWGGSMGFRLTVLKLLSDDAVEPVAAFYRRALARHGEVLDCSAADAPAGCDGETGAPGGRLLKVEHDRVTHIVSLKPADGGVEIQLVRVALGRAAAGR